MKRCSFFCGAWWAFLVLPLAMLVAVVFFQKQSIERKVASNAAAKLAEQGHKWAGVETFNRGRDVLVTGTAPNLEASQEAVNVTKAAAGVRVAEFHQMDGNIAAPTQPEFSIKSSGNIITLSGILANQAAIDELVEKAGKLSGDNKVVNRLQLGTNTSSIPNASALLDLINQNGLADNFQLELDQQALTLNGVVQSDATKAAIGESLAQQMTAEYQGSIDNKLIVIDPKAECLKQINEVLTSSNINFETAKATIKEDSFGLLNELGKIAKQCPDARFEVAGHTDSIGRLNSNLRLSENRAMSVVNYLLDLGLAKERFIAAGYGPEKPIADNATEQGRAANRRIEFKLIKN